MKRTILSLALLASISLTSFAATEAAQQKKEKKDFPKEMKLSDDQKEKIEKINKDFAEKKDAVKKSRIVEEVQKERIQALNKEKREAINELLTPEQQAQFAKKTHKGDRGEKNKPSRRSDRHAKGQGHTSHEMMRDGMFKDLDLTDAQKGQMKELREKYSTERQTTAEAYKKDIEKILTPEQNAKLEQKRESFKESRKGRANDMQKMGKLDEAGKAKFKELKEAYMEQKGAIERSRIAPDMQKQKLEILKEKFNKDKEELFKLVK